MKYDQISNSITRYEALTIQTVVPVPPSIFSSDNKLIPDRVGDSKKIIINHTISVSIYTTYSMSIPCTGDFIGSPPQAPTWSQEEINRELHAAASFSSEAAPFESVSLSVSSTN